MAVVLGGLLSLHFHSSTNALRKRHYVSVIHGATRRVDSEPLRRHRTTMGDVFFGAKGSPFRRSSIYTDTQILPSALSSHQVKETRYN